jgi:hypothetical protein
MKTEHELTLVDQNELLAVEGGSAGLDILTTVSKTVIKGLNLDIKDLTTCGGPNGTL